MRPDGYKTVSRAPVLWMSTNLQLLRTSTNSLHFYYRVGFNILIKHIFLLHVKVFMSLSDLNHWSMTLEIKSDQS